MPASVPVATKEAWRQDLALEFSLESAKSASKVLTAGKARVLVGAMNATAPNTAALATPALPAAVFDVALGALVIVVVLLIPIATGAGST
jgi:seryl-tRNA(Sec) selenium transferase